MSNQWFGYRPFAEACVGGSRVATPIGASCAWCRDPIMPDDNGFMVTHLHGCGHMIVHPWHLNCEIRSIIGGINHQKRTCFCFGGTLDADPPELSAREAADLAADFWVESAA